MPRCVVNVAVGKWYPRGQARLAESLDAVGYDGRAALWQHLSPGSPPHSRAPYAFKVHALQEAADRGHDVLLWCDASVWFVRDPEPVFECIERDGYYLSAVPGSHYVGQWCSDDALKELALTREEAMTIPMVTGGFIGLNLRSTGRVVLEWQAAHARAGTFAGSWTNERGQVSADPRVKGHRHDQPSLSVLAWNLGLKVDGPSGYFVYHAQARASARTVAFTRGMR